MARRELLGLFEEPGEAAEAVAGLRAAGFAGRDLTVLSDTPYPEGAFGEEPIKHRLHVFTLVGALCGFAIGLLLTIATQISYPLVTQGMPILAIPPMMIIVFESTMLGAIVLTVLGVLFEARLLDFGSNLYDARISEGYLGVLVAAEGDRRAIAERIMQRAGAIDIVRQGGV